MNYDELIEQYRIAHLDPTMFPGRSILPYAYIVNQLIRKHKSKTILDYGCGQGIQYTIEKLHNWWGIKPTLYDPGVDKYSSKPTELFDGVICTDVLEHIPIEHLNSVMLDVYDYAKQWVFFTVCCRPARRTLPNGLNTHQTIKPKEWWIKQFDRFETLNRDLHVRYEFTP